MIKTLLESQEKAYKSAIEIITDQLYSKILALKSKVYNLKTSLEFTQAEVVELKGQVKIFEKDKTKSNTKIEAVKHQINEPEKRTNCQEDYSRRNNLRINGMKERPGGETWEQTACMVSSLLQDKMQLLSVPQEQAHRVGRPLDDRPRPIVVRFERFIDRETTLRNASMLCGTGKFINEDLCSASQALKTSQLPQLK